MKVSLSKQRASFVLKLDIPIIIITIIPSHCSHDTASCMNLIHVNRAFMWRLYFFFLLSLFIFILASAATLVNIRNARKHFEKLERLEGTVPASSVPPMIRPHWCWTTMLWLFICAFFFYWYVTTKEELIIVHRSLHVYRYIIYSFLSHSITCISML